MKIFIFILFLAISSCKNPLSGDDSSQVGSTYSPGLNTPKTDFDLDLLFANAGSFTTSDSSIEFIGGSARLKTLNQTDNSTNLSSGPTLSNLVFDGSVVKLNTTTNNSSLSADWTPQWSNIIAYWKFDEPAGAASLADSGPAGTHNLLPTGNTLGIVGKVKGALSFTGSGISTGINSNSNTFTISAWIYPTASSGGILGSDDHAWDGHSFELSSNALIIHNCHPTACNDVASNAGIPQNFWSHVVVSVNAGTATFYINGIASGGGSPVEAFGIPWVIGSDGSGGAPYSGKIDELVIWGTALSADEVAVIYDRQSAVHSGQMLSRIFDATSAQNWSNMSVKTTLPTLKELASTNESTADYSALGAGLMDGVQAIWHLDELAGATNIIDSTSNANTATNNGAILGGKSLFNTGANFDGTARWIALPVSLESLPALSFNIWFQSTYDGVILGDSNAPPGGGASTYDPLIYIGTDGFVRGGSYCGGPLPVQNIISPNAVNDGQWHLASFTSAGGTENIFIDGVSIGSVACSSGAIGYFTIGAGYTNVWAGANNSWYYFHGRLDEASIWNRILSSGELLEIYHRGANRLKYQVRSCSNSACLDQESLVGSGWRGPDNSNLTYFSELNFSSLPHALTLDLSALNASLNPKRFFQYRTIFESDDATSPMLQSVAIGPDHYNSQAPSVTSTAAAGSNFVSLSSFSSTASCPAEARYALSPDGAHFYSWNGGAWSISNDYSTASDATTISAQISSFTAMVGAGVLQVESFLKSDGISSCSVSEIQISGQK